ncbi:MAG TPA: FHA domain-containing protein [Phycisphaerales bacterium]|nr:FHA domain-containing protein [Phycisphaerales bacterium]
MKIALVMVKADGTSREFPFDKSNVIIGRDEAARLRIPLPSVSRKHCELSVDDDELVVKDLGSANGTYVNGAKVKERELSPGDLLTVGGVVFVVRIDGYPAQIDAKDCYAAGMVSMDEGAGDDDFPGFPTRPAGGGNPGGKPLAPLGGSKKDDGLDDLLKDLELDDEDEKKK